MNLEKTDQLLIRINETLRRIGFAFPFLVGLVAKIDPQIDERIATVGIFATGRLLLNPNFVQPLSRQDLFFVLAHEIYHLMLRTHQRGEGSNALAFSFAHDYIINDVLRVELGLQQIPAGGLFLPDARKMSAEMLIAMTGNNRFLKSWNTMDPVTQALKQRTQQMTQQQIQQIVAQQQSQIQQIMAQRQAQIQQLLSRQQAHLQRIMAQNQQPDLQQRLAEQQTQLEQTMAEQTAQIEELLKQHLQSVQSQTQNMTTANSAAGGQINQGVSRATGAASSSAGSTPGSSCIAHNCDVLDEKTEREMFPELTGGSQSDQAAAVAEAAGNAQTMQNIMQEAALGRGSDPLGNEQMIDAVRRTYRPPWELGLQKWLESMTPTERSYARPSRRGADRVDVVLPGRKREGWTVHIVLDTSGSMTQEIPEALGAIAVFCEAMNVEEIHLIQCDAAIQEDEVLSPSQLSRWKVTGYGGSDLNPAMERLAERADVEAVIVLTDGDIAYPQESQPYQVLWVLPARVPLMSFRPPYGKVVSMNRNETR